MTLADDLRAEIAERGPIRVRDLMARSLDAYYGRGPAIGAGGDFYTASNVSLFPHAIRRFVDGASERMRGARVVEIGGGLGEVAARLERDVTIVDPSAGLRAEQAARGLVTVPSLAALEAAPSIVLANEVLDALPVHRVWRTDDGLFEGYVAWKDGRFVEVPGPLSPGLEPHAAKLAVGEKGEVCLDAEPFVEALARAAPTCIALFLDYATPTPRDTLRGFHEHRVTDPLERPGEQDITADVDLGLVATFAREAGFEVQGPVPQGELLADLGLIDDMTAALGRGDMAAYLAGKNLLLPGGMGERFQAIALVKGVPNAPLPGFRKDIYPGLSRR